MIPWSYLTPSSEKLVSYPSSQPEEMTMINCFLFKSQCQLLFFNPKFDPEPKADIWYYTCIFKYIHSFFWKHIWKIFIPRCSNPQPPPRKLDEDKKSLRVKRTVKSAQLSFEDRWDGWKGAVRHQARNLWSGRWVPPWWIFHGHVSFRGG